MSLAPAISFHSKSRYFDLNDSGIFFTASPIISICLITALCLNLSLENFSLFMPLVKSSIFFILSRISSINNKTSLFILFLFLLLIFFLLSLVLLYYILLNQLFFLDLLPKYFSNEQ